MTRRCWVHLTDTRLTLAVLCRREDGAVAIEFGLLGAVLLLSLVAMADLGLALSERMALEHTLRSGAQQAMADLGETNVLATINVAAEEQSFTICSGASPANGSFCPEVEVSCFCPNGSATSCTNPVACPVTFQKTYTISATKKRDNMIFPDFNFNVSLKVQSR
jgi:pilus assembly protein CpaE